MALQLFDLAHIAHLVHAGQGERQAFCVTTSCAANTVDMDFAVWRDIDIDNGF